MQNVNSYDDANFDADFDRALAGTTGDLTTQVSNTEQVVRASLSGATVVSTAAQIKASGVSSSGSNGVQVLVVAETYAVDAAGHSTDTGQQRLSSRWSERNGTWLASAMTVIGYQ